MNILALLAIGPILAALSWHIHLAILVSRQPDRNEIIVLGLTIWLVYTLDRLLDVRGKSVGELPPGRHRTIRAHRATILVVWCLLLALDLLLGLGNLGPADLAGGSCLAGMVLAYLALLQVRRGRYTPKEPLVAALFAGGTVLFIATGNGPTGPLVSGVISLFFLALANLFIVSRHERDMDLMLGETTGATRGADPSRLVPGLLVLAVTVAIPGGASAVSASLTAAILLIGATRLPSNQVHLGADLALAAGAATGILAS